MNELTISESCNLIEGLAQAVCKSGLYQIKTPEQAQVLMHLCRSKGLDPIQAVERYHIMNGGRPSMRADAMLAEFQRQGGRVRWLERNERVARAEFAHELGGTIEVEWTIEMAQKAGLLRNQTWSSYPRQMLTARVISEGVRTVLPGVVSGIYTPEEEGDIDAVRAPAPAPAGAAPAASSTTRAPRRAAASAPPPPSPAAPAPAAVVEAEFTEVAPVPATAAVVEAEPQPATEEPSPSAEVAEHPLAGWEPAEREAYLADLPASADGMTFQQQSALAKLLYKGLPPEAAEETRAALRGAASDAARIGVLNKRLAEVRA